MVINYVWVCMWRTFITKLNLIFFRKLLFYIHLYVLSRSVGFHMEQIILSILCFSESSLGVRWRFMQFRHYPAEGSSVSLILPLLFHLLFLFLSLPPTSLESGSAPSFSWWGDIGEFGSGPPHERTFQSHCDLVLGRPPDWLAHRSPEKRSYVYKRVFSWCM